MRLCLKNYFSGKEFASPVSLSSHAAPWSHRTSASQQWLFVTNRLPPASFQRFTMFGRPSSRSESWGIRTKTSNSANRNSQALLWVLLERTGRSCPLLPFCPIVPCWFLCNVGAIGRGCSSNFSLKAVIFSRFGLRSFSCSDRSFQWEDLTFAKIQ